MGPRRAHREGQHCTAVRPGRKGEAWSLYSWSNSGQHCPLAVEVGIAKPPGRGAWEGATSPAAELQESAGSAGSGPTAGSATHFSSHALRPLRGPSASCTGLPVLHDPLLSWRDWSCQFVYPPLLGIPIDSQALGCATLKSTVLQGAGESCVDTPSRRLPLLAKKHTSLCLHIALCLQVKVAQIQPSAQFHLSLPVTEPTMLSNWNAVLPA